MKHLTEVTSRLEAVRQSGLYVNGLQLKNTCIKHLLLQFPYLETILKEIDRGWCFLDANFNAYSVVRGLDSQNFLDTNWNIYSTVNEMESHMFLAITEELLGHLDEAVTREYDALDKKYDTPESLIVASDTLLEKLEKLRRKHYVCDDPYYSCPLGVESWVVSKESSDVTEEDCDCGAREHNALLDEVIEIVKGMK